MHWIWTIHIETCTAQIWVFYLKNIDPGKPVICTSLLVMRLWLLFKWFSWGMQQPPLKFVTTWATIFETLKCFSHETLKCFSHEAITWLQSAQMCRYMNLSENFDLFKVNKGNVCVHTCVTASICGSTKVTNFVTIGSSCTNKFQNIDGIAERWHAKYFSSVDQSVWRFILRYLYVPNAFFCVNTFFSPEQFVNKLCWTATD